MDLTLFAYAVGALVVGLMIGWWFAARPAAALLVQRDLAVADLAKLRDADIINRLKLTEIEADRRNDRERLGVVDHPETGRDALALKLATIEAQQAERDRQFEERKTQLETQFAAVAGRALETAQAQFLQRADERFAAQKELSETGMKALLAPVAETLVRYEASLTDIEAKRNEAYGGLKEQLVAVTAGQQRVSDEASKLVSALRSSGKTSGSWGEQQLRNVLEMAGLREGIDFNVQTSIASDTGAKRPDAIINLPGGRQLIIDSKCSLNDYLSAGEADTEDARRAAYKRHAAAVRIHAKGLGEKAYWKDFGQSADFVVMFLPGENFLSAALEHDLSLFTWASEQRILLAGPTNLLAIAKIVALTWQQDQQSKEWREIGKLGADLHAALATMADHVAGIGKNLGQAVGAYNSFVGSLEGNVLPKARRFTELGVEEGKKPVARLGQVDAAVRVTSALELLPPPRAEAAE